MTSAVEHPTEHSTHDHDPSPNPTGRLALYSILGIIIVAGIIYGGYKWWKSRNPETKQDTVGEIQNMFKPPQIPNTATGTPFITPEPKAPTTTVPSGTPPSVPPEQLRPVEYRNSNLAFTITLPIAWKVDETRSTDERVVFAGPNPGESGFIEAYQVPPDVSLGELEEMYANNPSVTNLSRVSVNGEDALRYTSNRGITTAVIYRGRVYYLHDAISQSPIIDHFKFL